MYIVLFHFLLYNTYLSVLSLFYQKHKLNKDNYIHLDVSDWQRRTDQINLIQQLKQIMVFKLIGSLVWNRALLFWMNTQHHLLVTEVNYI